MAQQPEPPASHVGDRSSALYERPPLQVDDVPSFSTVKVAVEGLFAPGNVERFLSSLQRAGLRIREFEAILRSGKLGTSAAELYARLTHGDQGLIREFYLAALERVEPSLRDRYFKLYAYY